MGPALLPLHTTYRTLPLITIVVLKFDCQVRWLPLMVSPVIGRELYVNYNTSEIG
jgi:hypothetical protein